MRLSSLVVFLLLVGFVATAPVRAEEVRIGVVSGVDLVSRPTYADVQAAFDDEANVIPGLSLEVVGRDFGVGVTGLVRFDRPAGLVPEGEPVWSMDWIGSVDFRFHPLRRFLLDPFLEAGFGSAGRVRLSEVAEQPTHLSLFSQFGGGVAARLGSVLLGARVLYRFASSPVPATSFEMYPLKSFHVDIFAGLSL